MTWPSAAPRSRTSTEMTALRTRDTLTMLYRGYAHAVLRRAARMLGTRADAEDVLHDLFTRWHQNPAELDAMHEPAAFIYGATTHACLNRLRDGKTRARLIDARTPRDEASAAPLGEARVRETHGHVRDSPRPCEASRSTARHGPCVDTRSRRGRPGGTCTRPSGRGCPYRTGCLREGVLRGSR